MHLDDTIVAISSPPGKSWRGIVRLSGPDAISTLRKVFTSPEFAPDGNLWIRGHVTFDNRLLPAFAAIFRAPHSYTRQDVAEIHLLGSPVLLGMLVKSCIAAGARRAEPGEFTARAYLCGAMDLSSVHGIAGVIAARSDSQLRAAEHLMRGSLSKTANAAREQLAELLSLVEGAIDFADEPIEFITPAELCKRLEAIHASLEGTMSAAVRTARWDRLPNVVLMGQPNAGKSSLFNRLTGIDRAISAPIAGTTRDVISAPMMIGGIECLLIDSPGLMQEASGLDAEAVSQTHAALRDADLILEIVDVTDESRKPGPRGSDRTIIRVGNKLDLLTVRDRPSTGTIVHSGTGFLGRILKNETGIANYNIVVSATTGENCDQLKALIGMALHERETDAHDSAIAMMSEHRDALDEAVRSVDQALILVRESAGTLNNGDLVALELHTAANALGILVGQDQTEELLGRIFSQFCVGK